MIDIILNFFLSLVTGAIELLPESPFANIEIEFNEFHRIMGYINYFVPIGTILSILTLYLTAVGLYYAVRWILRIAQFID